MILYSIINHDIPSVEKKIIYIYIYTHFVNYMVKIETLEAVDMSKWLFSICGKWLNSPFCQVTIVY